MVARRRLAGGHPPAVKNDRRSSIVRRRSSEWRVSSFSVAWLGLSVLLVLSSCGLGGRDERRYGTTSGRTGIASAAPTTDPPESTTTTTTAVPTVVNRDTCEGERRVQRPGTDDEIDRLEPWRWPLEATLVRCTATLRVDDTQAENKDHAGYKWWPYAPLPTDGGVSLTIGSVDRVEDHYLVKGVELENERPTAVRIRVIRMKVVGPQDQIVAEGHTTIEEVSLAEMQAGVVVPAGRPGEPGALPLPNEIALTRRSADVFAEVDLVFEYDIRFYDRLFRVVSGETVTAYAEEATPQDVDAAAASGAKLKPRSGDVVLPRNDDTCVTNRSYGSFDDAAQALSLPWHRLGKARDRAELDPAFLVELEVISWPEWDEIVKSGPVVAEVPETDTNGEPVKNVDETALASAGGWELCAEAMRVRVVSIRSIPNEAE